jgi:hypothetical protein
MAAQQAEPEHRQRRQDAALVRDRGVQDVVVGRDPVGGDQQQRLVVDLVEVADLPGREVRVVREHSHGRRG